MLQRWFLPLIAMPIMAQSAPSVRIEGRVMGPADRPQARAQVALVPLAKGSTSLLTMPRQETGDDGRFSIAAAPGKYALSITAPACLPHFQIMELGQGRTFSPLGVTLKSGGIRVKGRLAGTSNRPNNQSVIAFSLGGQGDGDLFFAETKDGGFDITLAPGPYLAIAETNDEAGICPVEVRNGLAEVVVHLETNPEPAAPATLAWIRRSAIPLRGVDPGPDASDLEPLRALVGEARVVGLGEATHGSREFFQLKHRLLEYLVQKLGFNTFIMEAGMAEAEAVDAYVLHGRGDPAKALAGLGFWTWDTREVLELFQWMRRYNLDPAHHRKIRFYGIDMQFDHLAYQRAKAWLDRVDPASATRLRGIQNRMSRLRSSAPDPASGQGWNKVVAGLKDLAAQVRRKDRGSAGYEKLAQYLRLLTQYAGLEADPERRAPLRDQAMADNLQWVLARARDTRAVVWAHNGHISAQPDRPGTPGGMGWHLRQALGKAYLPIGMAFGEGGFRAFSLEPGLPGVRAFQVSRHSQGTLDAALAAAGLPFLALDLRSRPSAGPVRQWLESPQGSWSIGATFATGQDEQYVRVEPVASAYDVLLFVDRVTAAEPLPEPATKLPLRRSATPGTRP